MRRPNLQIGVMGGAFVYSEKALAAARIIGEEIAKAGCTLITGGTTGIPYEASKGTRAKGGLSVGISPAVDAKEHAERFKKPLDYDVIIYTGFGYSGRNPINIRACDGVIYIGGESGTLNEFTNGLYEARILGVLEGVGGVTDKIRDLIASFKSNHGSKVIFDTDPIRLVKRVIELVKSQPNVSWNVEENISEGDHVKWIRQM